MSKEIKYTIITTIIFLFIAGVIAGAVIGLNRNNRERREMQINEQANIENIMEE